LTLHQHHYHCHPWPPHGWFLPLLQEYLNVSHNCVCVKSLPFVCFHSLTHTHIWHDKYLCQQYEWGILDHAPYRIGHLTVSISLMMKPNNVWKTFDADTEKWTCTQLC
jgi:hypothetical protein